MTSRQHKSRIYYFAFSKVIPYYRTLRNAPCPISSDSAPRTVSEHDLYLSPQAWLTTPFVQVIMPRRNRPLVIPSVSKQNCQIMPTTFNGKWIFSKVNALRIVRRRRIENCIADPSAIKRRLIEPGCGYAKRCRLHLSSDNEVFLKSRTLAFRRNDPRRRQNAYEPTAHRRAPPPSNFISPCSRTCMNRETELAECHVWRPCDLQISRQMDERSSTSTSHLLHPAVPHRALRCRSRLPRPPIELFRIVFSFLSSSFYLLSLLQ